MVKQNAQNRNSAEYRMMGYNDDELLDREMSGADGFEPYPNTKGGGNKMGGKGGKKMNPSTNISITQKPGKTVKTVVTK
jgi:hypothetical protein